MRLIVGLGNPGPQYAATRHNAGFWWVENLAEGQGVSLRTEGRFHGRVARLQQGQEDLWLLLPDTFMNLSGKAVAALAGFYKIAPEDILVVHDELDLAPGTARLKKGGGTGGHNGLKDIAARLGTAFWRLRLGIGHPGERAKVLGFVLNVPPKAEAELISEAVQRSLEIFPLIRSAEMEKATHRLHSKPAAVSPPAAGPQ